MILCKYKDLEKYKEMLPYLEKGMVCVEELRTQGFPTGKYEFEGGFLMVQRGSTKDYDREAFESHRKFMDVQYMISGGEIMYYAPVDELESNREYDAGADIEFFTENTGKELEIAIRPGMVWVAYPQDGHMPCRHKETANDYVKIVMKLPVNHG